MFAKLSVREPSHERDFRPGVPLQALRLSGEAHGEAGISARDHLYRLVLIGNGLAFRQRMNWTRDFGERQPSATQRAETELGRLE